MITEWRINRARRRIAANKARLQIAIKSDNAGWIAEIMADIASDQMLLAQLQGFAQNHDAELRKPINLKITKETEHEKRTNN